MKELDPILKRLLRWARAAAPTRPEIAPVGFASRVVARRNPVALPTLCDTLQQTTWAIAGVSLVVIVCGSLVLAHQRSAPVSTAEISSVVNFMASKLTQ